MTENQKTRYRCPSCKKYHHGSDEHHLAPFCSERCQLVDLGSWMQESYSIPVSGEDVHDSVATSNSLE